MALLCALVNGVTLSDKQAVNAALLASGAPIGQMNTVRKHLSRVKGGQLAAVAYPAWMLALMNSDVPGDDPATIGSGPTVGDASTPADARAVLDHGRIAVPASVSRTLDGGSGVVMPAIFACCRWKTASSPPLRNRWPPLPVWPGNRAAPMKPWAMPWKARRAVAAALSRLALAR